jgi:4-hydroxybenzoate polyprenyltransferase
VPRHVLLALASSLLLLFSHCWILLYLIATARAIRQAVQQFGVDAPSAAAARRLKRAASPWLILAMGLALATFVLGGGSVTGAVPAWAHHALFYVTVAVQMVALWIEKRVLDANERLMGDIDRKLGTTPIPVPSGTRAQGLG